MLLLIGIITTTTISAHLNSPDCGRNSLLEQLDETLQFIVGGSVADGVEQWPWACSIGFQTHEDWEHWCGGTIITLNHILTAAHCPEMFENQGRNTEIKVRCGDSHLQENKDNDKAQVRRVSKYFLHENILSQTLMWLYWSWIHLY